LGRPLSPLGCAVASFGQSLARVKFEGAAPHKGRNVVSGKKVHYGLYTLGSITFSFMDQSIQIFSPNVGWVMVNKVLFRFSICGSVPEIFAIKFESCQKSRWILDDFLPCQICGSGPSKNCTQFIIPASRHVDRKSFMRILPLARKLLSLTRWILGQILNFTINFLWGPLPLGVCSSKLWSISSACKNLRGQHP